MENLKQIGLISKALNKQRERYLFEISKVNSLIKLKQDLVVKMISYLSEYVADGHLSSTKSNPALLKNFEAFLQQIHAVIVKTENEIQDLIKLRADWLSKLQASDGKISVMDHFEDRTIKRNNEKQSKHEQLTIDDMSLVKHMRSKNE